MRKCDYLTQNENENGGIAITIQTQLHIWTNTEMQCQYNPKEHQPIEEKLKYRAQCPEWYKG